MTGMPKRVSAQQVAVAWVKSLPDFMGIPVATTLAPQAGWGTGVQDFVVAGFSLGGIPGAYTLTRVPVVQMDCFAKAPNSNRPAWNRASMLTEALRDACYSGYAAGVLSFAGGFPSVTLHSVVPMSEPRRILSDVAAIAHYSIDLAFTYSPVAVLV